MLQQLDIRTRTTPRGQKRQGHAYGAATSASASAGVGSAPSTSWSFFRRSSFSQSPASSSAPDSSSSALSASLSSSSMPSSFPSSSSSSSPQMHRHCFVGSEAVEWMLGCDIVASVDDAVRMCDIMLSKHLIREVQDGTPNGVNNTGGDGGGASLFSSFQNSRDHLYRFAAHDTVALHDDSVTVEPTEEELLSRWCECSFDVHLCSLLCSFLGSSSALVTFICVLCTLRTQNLRSICNSVSTVVDYMRYGAHALDAGAAFADDSASGRVARESERLPILRNARAFVGLFARASYANCFAGKTLCAWLMQREIASTVNESVRIGNRLLTTGLIRAAVSLQGGDSTGEGAGVAGVAFANNNRLFQFGESNAHCGRLLDTLAAPH
jgi:hypothetical protein